MRIYTLLKTEKEIDIYYAGLEDGIREFAYWMDGIQYVGTTGKTLKKAIEELAQAKEIDLIRIREIK